MRIYKPSIIARFKKLHRFNKGRFLTAIGMALFLYAFSILTVYLACNMPEKANLINSFPYGLIAFGVISFIAGLYCEWESFKILEDQ